MRFWPRRLAARLACAFVLALVTVAVLSLVVERLDPGPKPTKRASAPEAAAAGREAGVGRRGAIGGAGPVLATAILNPGTAPARRGSFEVARRLRPTKGTIRMAHREASLAPDIAPVVEILASGELILRRPEPLATGPLQAAPLSRGGHGAGVVLPVQNLENLTPAARGALIALLQQWLVERPVAAAKLQSSDVLMSKAAVRRLLSWVP